jgi:U1 small nuclear ribonucleoprotein C
MSLTTTSVRSVLPLLHIPIINIKPQARPQTNPHPTEIGHEKAQSVIDSITSSYAAEGQSSSNPMLGQNPGVAPPPPFAFPPPGFPPPGGMIPPPGGMIPPPGGRGMPPFPAPGGPGAPPFPIPGLPFPPPGGLPPNFQFPPLPGGFQPPPGFPPMPGPPGGFDAQNQGQGDRR